LVEAFQSMLQSALGGIQSLQRPANSELRFTAS
jgi:hypothetical protein